MDVTQTPILADWAAHAVGNPEQCELEERLSCHRAWSDEPLGQVLPVCLASSQCIATAHGEASFTCLSISSSEWTGGRVTPGVSEPCTQAYTGIVDLVEPQKCACGSQAQVQVRLCVQAPQEPRATTQSQPSMALLALSLPKPAVGKQVA